VFLRDCSKIMEIMLMWIYLGLQLYICGNLMKQQVYYKQEDSI